MKLFLDCFRDLRQQLWIYVLSWEYSAWLESWTHKLMHVFGKGNQTKLLKCRTGMQYFVFNVVQVRVAVHVLQRNWLENDR